MKLVLRNSVISVRWSKCWYERHPWSDEGVILPYIGIKKQTQDTLSLYIVTLGPIAVLYGYP